MLALPAEQIQHGWFDFLYLSTASFITLENPFCSFCSSMSCLVLFFLLSEQRSQLDV